MTAGPDRASLVHGLEVMAQSLEADGAPAYARICRGMATDEGALGLLEAVRPEQRRANLLLGAVHYLLLSGVADPLAAWFPTVQDLRRHPLADPDHDDAADGQSDPVPGGDPSPAFAAFCHTHRAALAELLETRATQTNEIGRCAVLLPGLTHVHALAGRPLAVLDLGASAGLNLRFDRYAYDYGEGRRAGDPDSPVQLGCELVGAVPPTDLPPVSWRRGLDLRPLDVADDDDARWLLACLWPEHLPRFRRLRRALALARNGPPVEVVEGDLVDDLAGAAAGADPDAHLVVLHSWAAAYLDEERQRALAAALALAAASRPLSWLFAEAPYEIPGLPVPPAPPGARPHQTALVHARFAAGAPGPATVTRLAECHSHGRWLQWWEAPGP